MIQKGSPQWQKHRCELAGEATPGDSTQRLAVEVHLQLRRFAGYLYSVSIRQDVREQS